MHFLLDAAAWSEARSLLTTASEREPAQPSADPATFSATPAEKQPQPQPPPRFPLPTFDDAAFMGCLGPVPFFICLTWGHGATVSATPSCVAVVIIVWRPRNPRDPILHDTGGTATSSMSSCCGIRSSSHSRAVGSGFTATATTHTSGRCNSWARRPGSSAPTILESTSTAAGQFKYFSEPRFIWLKRSLTTVESDF